MHYFHAKQWGIDVILGGGKWYKRKDIEEVHAKKNVFIEEE
jgi:calcineurin-like phosphoesterase